MKFIFKRVVDKEMQTHLNMVQETLNSGYFILIDLLFWSFFLSVVTANSHHSLKIALLIFVCFYLFGAALYLILKKWIKD